MNLSEHYHKLYTESVAKIASGDYELDPLIDDVQDKRFGITLVIRPDLPTKQKIQQFLDQLKSVEPEQYYYSNPDLHITLLSVISCYEGFNLHDIHVEDYVRLIQESLNKYPPFNIQLKGLTASTSCILVQGFATAALNLIRDDLRIRFKSSALQQSIDTRYAIQTAHSTIVRFRKPLSHTAALLNLLAQYRDFDFGTFEVEQIELVYNDWYQRERFVKTLQVFDLKSE